VHVSAIIAAGGRGSRFGSPHPKQILMLRGRPVLRRSVEAFVAAGCVTDIVVALPGELVANPPEYLRAGPGGKPIEIVEGGLRRQDSVARAFARVSSRADVVVIHDAARPLVSVALIEQTVAAAAESGAAVAAVRARDTVKRVEAGRVVETLPRDAVVLEQTPQAFRVDVLRDALASSDDATDEAALAERAGHAVRVVEGDPRNLKITTAEDLLMLEGVLGRGAAGPRLRVGNGYDLHRLVPGRPLVLGGMVIPFELGLDGHSDADAVCQAVIDAILGACGAGDVGRLFPDTDPSWAGADSLDLLRRAAAIVRDRGFDVVNVDVVVIAQRPKLAPYIETMRARVAEALGCDPAQVGVKGKTNEGVDSVGRGESIAAHAVALLCVS
jgi:2-C-methyl-D-erythritol 4-phosphate cytidylyltransferase/2-C-methyl-D-erythritol 2,4-cyclodiphosphate synthase